ncbi:hypothetical protein D3C84_202180 [compost metagenome]
MIGIVVVCIDIAILVALFSLPPLLWLFGGHLIELEVKWRLHAGLNVVLVLLPIVSTIAADLQGHQPL